MGVSCFGPSCYFCVLMMTALIGCATESGGPPQDDATVFMVDGAMLPDMTISADRAIDDVSATINR